MKENFTKISLKATSLNFSTLFLYSILLRKTLKKFNIEYSFIFLPKIKSKITVLKSPHVNKKAREQFEFVKHSFLLSLHISNLNTFYLFLIKNKPKIVDLSLTYRQTCSKIKINK
jgi:ribosomal protein S10